VYVFDTATGNLVYTLDNPNSDATNANGDGFGSNVALYNNTLAVGAYAESNFSGKVYIYDLSNGTITYTLDNPNAYTISTNDLFGLHGLSIYDKWLAVGVAYEDNSSSESNAGRVYIFDLETGNHERTFANMNNYGGQSSDYFGDDVVLGPTYLVITAPGEDDASGNSSGIAYHWSIGAPGVPGTTNLTDSNFIGFAKDNFDSATIGKVVGVGGVIDGLTGLVVGTDYYIQPDGSLSATETEGSVFAGTAITTSSLEIKYGTGTWQGERGVFLNSGEYINFATVGSATNFPVSIGGPSDVVNSGFSDGTTVFAASYSAFNTYANMVTLSTAEPMSESTSFGRQNRGITAAGNGITGLAASGAGYDYQSRDYEWTDRTNDIYAINIVTKVGGNVIGDLLTTPYASTANNNTTNAFFSGGSYGSTAVQTVAFESLGNASYFGHNLGLVRRWAAGAGNENKAFIIGGYMTTQTGGALNSIDGFNTQTAGTSESLGSLTVQREGNVSISDGTYIVAAGGANTYGYGRTGYVSSDRFVIDTGGTAEAFGDLGSGQYKSAGASGNSA
jgi:hypothetical protein